MGPLVLKNKTRRCSWDREDLESTAEKTTLRKKIYRDDLKLQHNSGVV